MPRLFDAVTAAVTTAVKTVVMSAVTSAVTSAVMIAVSSPLAAQDNYEIQVYGAETVRPRTTMYELHSNFTMAGRKFVSDGELPTHHAWHETVEITHGFTSWSEVGFYFFTSARATQGWRFVGSHIRPRVRAPESWHWPVGASLSMEVGYQRPEYSADTWTWEIRPIVDKDIGACYVSFNPTLARALRGPGTTIGLGFAPNATLTRDVTREVNFGVEYYGGVGSLRRFDPAGDQQHQVFAVVNLNVSPDWEFNAGLGWGLSPTTEGRIAKVILGRRVGPKL